LDLLDLEQLSQHLLVQLDLSDLSVQLDLEQLSQHLLDLLDLLDPLDLLDLSVQEL
jgi:hypothetical protein